MIRAHWQDRIEVALGLWLVASPFVLDITRQPAAWSAMLAGVAVVTLAVEAFYYPEIVEEWGNLAVGIGLAASPWLFGYDGERLAMINALACGIAIAALSFWTAEDIQREQRDAH
ncbi:MAG: SPW repeat protein [Burkholderiaceae bacterium]|nr:SPW repeat protein [Burkholderiaceae bacterium]